MNKVSIINEKGETIEITFPDKKELDDLLRKINASIKSFKRKRKIEKILNKK